MRVRGAPQGGRHPEDDHHHATLLAAVAGLAINLLGMALFLK